MAVDELSAQSVDITAKIAKESLEYIQKLLSALFKGGKWLFSEEIKQRKALSLNKVGAVDLKTLKNNAELTGEKLLAQTGVSTKDTEYIAQKAAEMGIPVAITGVKGADTVSVSFRESDKERFAEILTKSVKDKIKEKPDGYTMFKIKPPEIETITATLTKNDLAFNIIRNQNGDIYCLHENKDKKAFEMAKNEVKKNHAEVLKNCEISRENEFCVIKDNERTISFTVDDIKNGRITKPELSEMLQKTFGYDEIKANLAADKFGDTLTDEQQITFYEEMFAGVEIDRNITFEKENILVKDFDFYRMKGDGGENKYAVSEEKGKVAVVDPILMTRAQMSAIFESKLGITDKETINALIDKAEKSSFFYELKADKNLKHDIINGEKVFGEAKIGRQSLTNFIVSVNGKELNLIFADKQGAIKAIARECQSMGCSYETAQKSAKAIYEKAKKQSAKKSLRLTDVYLGTVEKDRGNHKIMGMETSNISEENLEQEKLKMKLTDGNTQKEYELPVDEKSKNKTIENIRNDFGMSEIVAIALIEKAVEEIEIKINAQQEKTESNSQKSDNLEKDNNPQKDNNPETSKEPEFSFDTPIPNSETPFDKPETKELPTNQKETEFSFDSPISNSEITLDKPTPKPKKSGGRKM